MKRSKAKKKNRHQKFTCHVKENEENICAQNTEYEMNNDKTVNNNIHTLVISWRDIR